VEAGETFEQASPAKLRRGDRLELISGQTATPIRCSNSWSQYYQKHFKKWVSFYLAESDRAYSSVRPHIRSQAALDGTARSLNAN